jgi:hypothetical protein
LFSLPTSLATLDVVEYETHKLSIGKYRACP